MKNVQILFIFASLLYAALFVGGLEKRGQVRAPATLTEEATGQPILNYEQRLVLLQELTDRSMAIIYDELQVKKIGQQDRKFKNFKNRLLRSVANNKEFIASITTGQPDVLIFREVYRIGKWMVLFPLLTAGFEQAGILWALPFLWNTLFSSKLMAAFYYVLRKKLSSEIYRFKFGMSLFQLEDEISRVQGARGTAQVNLTEFEVDGERYVFRSQNSLLNWLKAQFGTDQTTRRLAQLIPDKDFVRWAHQFKGQPELLARVLIERILEEGRFVKELVAMSAPQATAIHGELEEAIQKLFTLRTLQMDLADQLDLEQKRLKKAFGIKWYKRGANKRKFAEFLLRKKELQKSIMFNISENRDRLLMMIKDHVKGEGEALEVFNRQFTRSFHIHEKLSERAQALKGLTAEIEIDDLKEAMLEYDRTFKFDRDPPSIRSKGCQQVAGFLITRQP